ncbi:protein argonaute-3 [Teleopsis dalmanni]|uniref:protein argonaute-3 n=1 Tax=Teleopsis dalmanni TaxID=139649 RepID=UPI000D32B30E|nr:protein argonaute-3 [Teleopsis dalmanni]
MAGKSRGKLFELLSDNDGSLTSGYRTAPNMSSISSKLNAVSISTSSESTSSSGGEVPLRQVEGVGRRSKLFAHMLGEVSSISTKTEESNKPQQRAQIYNQKPIPTQTEVQNQGDYSGSEGVKVSMVANYIKLNVLPDSGVYEYNIKFTPNIEINSLKSKYLYDHEEILGRTKMINGSQLLLPKLLPNTQTHLISRNDRDGSEVKIQITFNQKKSVKDCLHLYNILFDRIMKTLNYIRVGKKQFDPTNPKIMPTAKLEIWPGYATAVTECEGGLMLCCNLSHRLLNQKTVLELLTEIYQSKPSEFQINAKKALLGSVVITRYNNKTYRIDEIKFDTNPLDEFDMKGQKISYVDYYFKTYRIDIKDKKQPLLVTIKTVTRPDNTVEECVFSLVPELCHLTGLQDNLRSDFKLMREIATFTKASPNQRLLSLEKFVDNVNNTSEAKLILSSWGLSLAEKPQPLMGRVLGEERVYFGSKNFGCGVSTDFGKYATNNYLLNPINVLDWILIYCKRDENAARTFIEQYEYCTNAMGIKVQRPKTVMLDNDRIDNLAIALRKAITRQTQIVVSIFPTNREDRYATMKKLCCTEFPVPSQVIIARTLGNRAKVKSIVQKIALQINCKVGGDLWHVNIPFKNVMICGVDVYHDPSKRQNSVSAFVSSLNNTYSKWFSQVFIQKPKEEVISGYCAILVQAIANYEKLNKCLPNNIIIYRDGISDGEFGTTAQYEIEQLKDICQNSYPQPILLTYIISQKRINARYFTNFAAGSAGNPSPGTIVDNIITRKCLYDFYLVSQSLREGTVTPTHYVVLNDDGKFKPDIIQRLTYKLTFMYYNWPGAIRVTACVQYAHKLAYLVGQFVKKHPGKELEDKLYYL